MNILRWKRKSKNKIRLKTLVLFIFSLIMTTFAWFAYSKILEPTLNIHLASWDMEYWIGTEKQENPEDGINIGISTLYPTMDEQTVIVDIYNNGETLVDIDYQVQSVTILGTEYEIVPEGKTNTTQNYVALANSVSATNASGENIYKGVITNDITRFPFTIEVEHSAQVEPVTEGGLGNIIPGEGYLKVTVNWIGDNNELDSEWGYLVGEYYATTNQPAISILLSIDSYQADLKAGPIEETLPTTAATRPYLPTGFTRVPGTNLSTGLVITDSSGNEYVWIEVPKNRIVYATATIDLELDSLTGDALTAAYEAIEDDLQEYSKDYRIREEVHTDIDAIGLSPSNYTALKQKMLKSIYNHGGFYIGRYETGIANSYRTSATTPSETPVVKANAYPYNYITCKQAHNIATNWYDKGLIPTGYTTSLMFGVQWDLVMKYLSTKGTSSDMIKTDSTTWGNYSNNSYSITKTNSKYMITNDWLSVIPYEKADSQQVLLATGANTGFSRQNIYDLAGNLAEWTYNVIFSDSYSAYIGGNGSDYTKNGTNSANQCGINDAKSAHQNVGFRVAIYSDASPSRAWGDDSIGSENS